MHLLRTTVCGRYRVFAGEGGKRAAIGECVAVECEEISHAAERPYVDLKDARGRQSEGNERRVWGELND